MTQTDDQRFYMTYTRSRPDTIVPWVKEHDVPLLTNAIGRWSDHTERLLPMWEYDTRHVIDAGGYNVMASFVTQSGELRSDVTSNDVADEHDTQTPFYPWTIAEYHEWLCDHAEEFAWATAMDYACEERFDPLWSYEQRMKATLDATIQQYELLEDSGHPYKLLPVLQGRTADDYVWFYDQLADYGIPTDHVGLGTVCRISSEKQIVDLEQTIRDRTDVERLHGFGVKIEAFKHGATFESADSQAWVYQASRGKVYIEDDERLASYDMKDDSLARTVESFKNYYSYVTKLQQGESAIKYDNGITPSMSPDDIRKTVTTRYES